MYCCQKANLKKNLEKSSKVFQLIQKLFLLLKKQESCKRVTNVLIQSVQQENKSRVLSHLLFYRNVSLSLIVHTCIFAIHSRFIGCLPLEDSIINYLIIND
jgi:hypothetical protein